MQELLYNISNLGVDTKRYNGPREPSVNRAGRQSIEGQGWGSHQVLGMQREMSVKEGAQSCTSVAPPRCNIFGGAVYTRER